MVIFVIKHITLIYSVEQTLTTTLYPFAWAFHVAPTIVVASDIIEPPKAALQLITTTATTPALASKPPSKTTPPKRVRTIVFLRQIYMVLSKV